MNYKTAMRDFTKCLAFTIYSAAILVRASSESSPSAGIVPTYSGSVTDIKCSTTNPTFLINDVYSFLSYHQLPDLFGIEAKTAPNSSSVSLCVNGTSLSHNVTIVCQNVISVLLLETDTLFRLILQYSDTIPAPQAVWYDRGKHILIWTVLAAASQVDGFDAANTINIDLKITHYNIYITDTQTEQVTIYTSDVTSLMIADNNVPCSALVQVSAVNPAGEGQRSPGIKVNFCNLDQDGVTNPDSTTGLIMNSDYEQDTARDNKKFLSSGGIVAVVIVGIFVVVILVFSFLIVLFIMVSKFTTSTLKNTEYPTQVHQPRSHQDPELLMSNSSPKVTSEQTSPATQHNTCHIHDSEETNKSSGSSNTNCDNITTTYSQGGPLIYAELAPAQVNPVSQPSSVENTTYAMLNHSTNTT